MTPSERLNVIALVSGGKDSFFSLLHCLANGHRVVALANLHPPPPPAAPPRPKDGGAGAGETGSASAGDEGRGGGSCEKEVEEMDLNSFMYQTVGHEVVPLYAAATGIPLFRGVIRGGIGLGRREYAVPSGGGGALGSGTSRTGTPGEAATATTLGEGEAPDQMLRGKESERSAAHQVRGEHGGAEEEEKEDETESMLPLLRDVMRAHPDANAVSAGAILSTYQRTRVESVAVRLGLVPLAFLWQFPVLPPPGGAGGGGRGAERDAQLLDDLHAAGLEARIVKVASGGLDERFLWADVGRPDTVARLERAMARFGGGAERGAVLGEGGEFETLVVDGPKRLFRKRIAVEDRHRRVVREGGGSAWVHVLEARLEDKGDDDEEEEDAQPLRVRIPSIWDARFAWVLARLSSKTDHAGESKNKQEEDASPSPSAWKTLQPARRMKAIPSFQPPFRCVVAAPSHRTSIQDETRSIVSRARSILADLALSPTAITSTVVVLRRMADFPIINPIYGALFPDPNPPSRVTISCGDVLPPGINMVLFLALYPSPDPSLRSGLHVQSRSYWAPANIGPYSQAVAVPALGPAAGPRVVAIAGQIPLVPASMALPAAVDEDFAMQAVLALQHLWRVGAAVDVRWWCSAAAYLPRCDDEAAASVKAVIAARAWRAAHSWRDASGGEEEEDDDDDDDEGGPDLWDRRNDAAYRTYGVDETADRPLPDWDVLECPEDVYGAAWRPIPAVFAAEVESLPRAAAVEWHAHVGIGEIPAGVRVRCGDATPVALSTPAGDVKGDLRWALLRDGTADRGWAHCVLALRPLPNGARIATAELGLGRLAAAALEPLGGWGVALDDAQLVSPDLVYADLSRFAEEDGGDQKPWVDVSVSAVIPCRRLWDARGDRLAAVLLFRIEIEG